MNMVLKIAEKRYGMKKILSTLENMLYWKECGSCPDACDRQFANRKCKELSKEFEERVEGIYKP